MRERDINRKLFHRAHYEILAKRFREALEPYCTSDADDTNYVKVGEYTRIQNPRTENLAARFVLVKLAMDLCLRLLADNEEFKPVTFLNRCSPNPDTLPLGKLWADYAKEYSVDVQ